MKRREFLYNSATYIALSIVAGKQLLAQTGVQDMNGAPNQNLQMAYEELTSL